MRSTVIFSLKESQYVSVLLVPHHYKTIESSVTEENWLKEVPNNKLTLIIAEGLISYLSEEEVKTLLNRLTDYFPNGEIIFNTVKFFC